MNRLGRAITPGCWRRHTALAALVAATLTLGACGDEEFGPPNCDPSLRDGSAANQWIRVESGSFRMGVNEDFQRRFYAEEGTSYVVRPQRDVTISRPFFAMATEVTNAMWDELVPVNPSSEPDCANCPVEFVRRAGALMFANALSERDGLEACYDLSACVGEPGTRAAACPVDLTFDFDCTGYRIPTAAEFEYIARAGTTTPHHCGDDFTAGLDPCLYDHEWTGENWRLEGNYVVQPVATLCPNPWGFYDVGGNVAKHLWDLRSTYDPEPWPEAAVDPIRPFDARRGVSTLQTGGTYDQTNRDAALAGRMFAIPVNSSLDTWFPAGFRLVRTVPEHER